MHGHSWYDYTHLQLVRSERCAHSASFIGVKIVDDIFRNRVGRVKIDSGSIRVVQICSLRVEGESENMNLCIVSLGLKRHFFDIINYFKGLKL